MTELLKVAVVCNCCEKEFILEVPKEGFNKWQLGKVPIQNALPDIPIGDRELLISQTCSRCFDHMFPKDAG